MAVHVWPVVLTAHTAAIISAPTVQLTVCYAPQPQVVLLVLMVSMS